MTENKHRRDLIGNAYDQWEENRMSVNSDDWEEKFFDLIGSLLDKEELRIRREMCRCCNMEQKPAQLDAVVIRDLVERLMRKCVARGMAFENYFCKGSVWDEIVQ